MNLTVLFLHCKLNLAVLLISSLYLISQFNHYLENPNILVFGVLPTWIGMIIWSGVALMLIVPLHTQYNKHVCPVNREDAKQ